MLIKPVVSLPTLCSLPRINSAAQPATLSCLPLQPSMSLLAARLLTLEASPHRSSAAQPAYTSPAANTGALHDTSQWDIRPSNHQVPVEQYTHLRPLPLPMSLDTTIDGVSCKAQYLGHGKSKVAYLLATDMPHKFTGKVLKLCKVPDQVPQLFKELSESRLYPLIHSSNSCIECDSVGQPVGQWNAWVTDYATPLDQFLKQPPRADQRRKIYNKC